MKARLLMAGLAFVAFSSMAVAQEKTKKADCSKAKTECCKTKEAEKAKCCDKATTTKKKDQKAKTCTDSAKKAEAKK